LGEEELQETAEVWTTNHRDSQGNPCDGCSECLPTEKLTLLVHQFQTRAKHYQKLELNLSKEEDRIEGEASKREKEQAQARIPLARELETQDKGKFKESIRLRGLFKEERRTLEKTLARGLEKLKGEADADLKEARRSYEAEVQALEKRHQVLTQDLRERLILLEAEQKRAREAFQAAAVVERTILRTRVRTAFEEFEQARDEIQQLCPHPSTETLETILNRWPTQGDAPKPGILRCRVCHQTLTFDQLEENVRRGGSTLAYSPTPVLHGGPSQRGGPDRERGGPASPNPQTNHGSRGRSPSCGATPPEGEGGPSQLRTSGVLKRPREEE
jgi:hypothetical protein